MLFSFFLLVVWLGWSFVRFSRNSFSNRCWKFQLSILKSKKVLFLKNIFFKPLSISKQKSFVSWPNFQWRFWCNWFYINFLWIYNSQNNAIVRRKTILNARIMWLTICSSCLHPFDKLFFSVVTWVLWIQIAVGQNVEYQPVQSNNHYERKLIHELTDSNQMTLNFFGWKKSYFFY